MAAESSCNRGVEKIKVYAGIHKDLNRQVANVTNKAHNTTSRAFRRGKVVESDWDNIVHQRLIRHRRNIVRIWVGGYFGDSCSIQ